MKKILLTLLIKIIPFLCVAQKSEDVNTRPILDKYIVTSIEIGPTVGAPGGTKVNVTPGEIEINFYISNTKEDLNLQIISTINQQNGPIYKGVVYNVSSSVKSGMDITSFRWRCISMKGEDMGYAEVNLYTHSKRNDVERNFILAVDLPSGAKMKYVGYRKI